MQVINGTSFKIPGPDFVLAGTVLSENGFGNSKYKDYCFSGVQAAGTFGQSTLYVLGRPFWQNVVAVFDVGGKEMRFAPREYGTCDDANSS